LTDEAASTEVHALLEVPGAERAAALERWLAAQPDAARAARILARTLATMDAELSDFLDAERLRFPLDAAAEQGADTAIKAELWAHASASSLITGEGADIPYGYARRAARTNPASEMAWAAVIESLNSDNTDFLGDDLETWIHLARQGTVPVEMVKRVFAGACTIAKQQRWSDADLAVLERLKPLVAEIQ